MHASFFIDSFKKNLEKDAIVWRNSTYSYSNLLEKYFYWEKKLSQSSISSGTVVVIEADFSPNAISLLLVLININSIIVPITDSVKSKKDEFIEISQGEIIIEIDNKDNVEIKKIEGKPNSINKYYKILKGKKHPGLVLFSSGSTGKSKASVHDLTYLLSKFKVKRHRFVAITFLLYDHIGGFNTLFYILSNLGMIVTAQDRSPSEVLRLIDKYNVELLPTSPTFLNLVLISEEFKNYDLSSLKIITYGTEPMPKTTLLRFNQLLPKVKFTQTYGLSEVGILRSKSKSSDSLWVKVGGEDYKTRVVNGMLEIKSKSSMLGYLNAISPFTNDGWFKTGDLVEIKNDYIKILGRKSEIINVGGEKVYPQEVENILLSNPKIKDATVFGEKNPILGNIVCANIWLNEEYDKKNKIKIDIRQFCNQNMERYKVPVKIFLINENLHNARFKKKRS
tara:strand:- start:21006 stop:22355 length:1350 start_codon:yes stop_codon:yes gene_type:complete